MEDVNEYREDDFLFDKHVECPLCGETTDVRMVKRSSLRLVRTDSDSMPIYKYITPFFYDVWQCSHCGYAALQSHFEHELIDADKKVLKQKVSSLWKHRNFPGVYKIDTALNRYKIALYCTELRHADKSESTLLYLKMAWIYRLQQTSEMEVKCLHQALEGFKSLYETGDFPVAGMDEVSLIYMIADLCNRTGDNKNALVWLGMLLSSKDAKSTLKDKARDLKYRISQESNQNASAV